MKIDARTPPSDVARAVCTALDSVGVTAVLTGGSAASYYAPDAYQSADLDFVTVRFGSANQQAVDESLGAIGFERRRDHYKHPESPFPVEFPPGPLAVGRQILTHWRTDRRASLVLHVLEPTDSCKDRLAAFLHWNDRSGLAQALAVARAVRSEIDFRDLADWAKTEGAAEQFEEFRRRVDADEAAG